MHSYQAENGSKMLTDWYQVTFSRRKSPPGELGSIGRMGKWSEI